MLYLTLDADFTIHKQLVEATAAGAAAQIDTLTNDGKAKQAIMVCVATASGSTIELETSDEAVCAGECDDGGRHFSRGCSDHSDRL